MRKKYFLITLLVISLLILLSSCDKSKYDEPKNLGNLIEIVYASSSDVVRENYVCNELNSNLQPSYCYKVFYEESNSQYMNETSNYTLNGYMTSDVFFYGDIKTEKGRFEFTYIDCLNYVFLEFNNIPVIYIAASPDSPHSFSLSKGKFMPIKAFKEDARMVSSFIYGYWNRGDRTGYYYLYENYIVYNREYVEEDTRIRTTIYYNRKTREIDYEKIEIDSPQSSRTCICVKSDEPINIKIKFGNLKQKFCFARIIYKLFNII